MADAAHRRAEDVDGQYQCALCAGLQRLCPLYTVDGFDGVAEFGGFTAIPHKQWFCHPCTINMQTCAYCDMPVALLNDARRVAAYSDEEMYEHHMQTCFNINANAVMGCQQQFFEAYRWDVDMLPTEDSYARANNYLDYLDSGPLESGTERYACGQCGLDNQEALSQNAWQSVTGSPDGVYCSWCLVDFFQSSLPDDPGPTQP